MNEPQHPRVRTAHVRGADLCWETEGEGPLVVFGHGVSSDRRAMEDRGPLDWGPVVDAGHTLVRMDWRGHGASTGDADPDQYTWPSLGEDLLALLDQLSPDEPVAAIGCSMGSASILHAAVSAPERFSRLVLTAPPTAWSTRAAQADSYLQLAEIAETGGASALEQLLAAQPARGIFAEDDQAPKICVSDRLLPAVLRGAATTDLPDPDAIRGLQLPALILSWADDPSHPVSTGELLHEYLGRSEFAVAQSLPEVARWGTLAADFLAAA